MISATTQKQINTFEETILQSTMHILNKISAELNKAEDYMSQKVQSLHRLFLSYLHKYQTLKKQLTTPELVNNSLPPVKNGRSMAKQNGRNSTIPDSPPHKNEKNSGRKESKLLDLSFPEPPKIQSGLLCPPSNKNP